MIEPVVTLREAKQVIKKCEYHIRKIAKYEEITYYDVWKYCTYGRDVINNLTEQEVIAFANKINKEDTKPKEFIKSCNKCYHYWLNHKTTNPAEQCFGRIDSKSCFRSGDDIFTYRVRKQYKPRTNKIDT